MSRYDWKGFFLIHWPTLVFLAMVVAALILATN